MAAADRASSTVGGVDEFEYGFPFPPYGIQKALMAELVDTIRQRRSGVFESPTGTGKTLSLICGTLSWLHSAEAKDCGDESMPLTALQSAAGSDEPSWFAEHDAKVSVRSRDTRLAELERRERGITARLQRVRLDEEHERSAKAAARVLADLNDGDGMRDEAAAPHQPLGRSQRAVPDDRKRPRGHAGGAAYFRQPGAPLSHGNNNNATAASAAPAAEPPETELILRDLDPDEEVQLMLPGNGGRAAIDAAGGSRSRTGAPSGPRASSSYQSDASLRAMRLADELREAAVPAVSLPSASSSGHGRRVGPGSADPASSTADAMDEYVRPKLFFVSRTHSQISQFVRELRKTRYGAITRVVSLGSRRTLCVNTDVTALGSDVKINERCGELQDEARERATVAATPSVVDERRVAGASAGLFGTYETSATAAAGAGTVRGSASKRLRSDADAREGVNGEPSGGPQTPMQLQRGAQLQQQQQLGALEFSASAVATAAVAASAASSALIDEASQGVWQALTTPQKARDGTAAASASASAAPRSASFSSRADLLPLASSSSASLGMVALSPLASSSAAEATAAPVGSRIGFAPPQPPAVREGRGCPFLNGGFISTSSSSSSSGSRPSSSPAVAVDAIASSSSSASAATASTNGTSASLQSLFRDRLLASGRDVEDAAELGRHMGTCAYYGSRKAVAAAHVVTMPYSMLLHKGTREAMGIDLRGSIVVIDEGHNIVDAVNATHSAVVTLPQLAAAHGAVRAYLERYRSRMSHSNVVRCSQLADAMMSCIKYLKAKSAIAGTAGSAPATSSSATVSAMAHRVAAAGAAAAATALASGSAPTSTSVGRDVPSSTDSSTALSAPTSTSSAAVTSPTSTSGALVTPTPASHLHELITGLSTGSTAAELSGSAALLHSAVHADDVRVASLQHTSPVPCASRASPAIDACSVGSHSVSIDHSGVSINVSLLDSAFGDVQCVGAAPTPITTLAPAAAAAAAPAAAAPLSASSSASSSSNSSSNGSSSALPPNFNLSSSSTSSSSSSGALTPNFNLSINSSSTSSGALTPSEFVYIAGLDNVNLWLLMRYVDAVGLLRKLRGFAEAGLHAANGTVELVGRSHASGGRPCGSGSESELLAGAAPAAAHSPSAPLPSAHSVVSALHATCAFLTRLTTLDDDGRVVVVPGSPNFNVAPSAASAGSGSTASQSVTSSSASSSAAAAVSLGSSAPHRALPSAIASVPPSLKFVMLNPSVHFRDIVDSARSVILAGGTMSPLEDLSQQLFNRPIVTRASLASSTSSSLISAAAPAAASEVKYGSVASDARAAAGAAVAAAQNYSSAATKGHAGATLLSSATVPAEVAGVTAVSPAQNLTLAVAPSTSTSGPTAASIASSASTSIALPAATAAASESSAMMLLDAPSPLPPPINAFSCGHIIPPSSLAAFACAAGPSGAHWDFRFGVRNSRGMMDELGRAILNIAACVPAGVVVFLPSYDYERTLLAHFARAPTQAAAGAPAGAPARAQKQQQQQQQSNVSALAPRAAAASTSPSAPSSQQQQQRRATNIASSTSTPTYPNSNTKQHQQRLDSPLDAFSRTRLHSSSSSPVLLQSTAGSDPRVPLSITLSSTASAAEPSPAYSRPSPYAFCSSSPSPSTTSTSVSGTPFFLSPTTQSRRSSGAALAAEAARILAATSTIKAKPSSSAGAGSSNSSSSASPSPSQPQLSSTRSSASPSPRSSIVRRNSSGDGSSSNSSRTPSPRIMPSFTGPFTGAAVDGFGPNPPRPGGSGSNGVSGGSILSLNSGAAAAATTTAAVCATSFPAAAPLVVGGVQCSPGSVLALLHKRKAVFREPKSATDMDDVLREYAAAATRVPWQKPQQHGAAHVVAAAAPDATAPSKLKLTPVAVAPSDGGASAVATAYVVHPTTHPSPSTTTSGAILFAVVGGKMSEGINFSDDLARCVVVVGLPYPNPSDPELREKMAFLDRQQQQQQLLATPSPATAVAAASAAPPVGSRTAGRAYYENLCMRAVNQSIGRSIRHAGDFSTIVLLDMRYSTARIRSKLPGWIVDRLSVQPTWAGVLARIGAFFKEKREQQR